MTWFVDTAIPLFFAGFLILSGVVFVVMGIFVFGSTMGWWAA